MQPRFPGDATAPQAVFEVTPEGAHSLDYVQQILQRSWRNYMVQKCLRELAYMSHDSMRRQRVIRVEVNDDGTINLLDFDLPSEIGRKKEHIPQEDVPTWIMETISMLRIAPEGDLVPELGFRVSDTVYFVSTERGVNNESNESEEDHPVDPGGAS